MKKIKVVGISEQDTGVFFYRIIQPLQAAAKQKLLGVHHLPFFGQHARHLTTPEFTEYFAAECRWADVLYTTAPSSREYMALVQAIQKSGRMKLVVDLDDDILAASLEPNNPAYRAHLDPGNRAAEYAQVSLREADMVTVSTEYLKKKYASVNPNIVVVKNCIDPKFFCQENKPDDITIGYAGSGSHQADWVMVEPVLKKLKEKYGVKIKVLGPMYTTIADEQIKWVDMLKYPEALASLGFSIGIAPLKDSMMSRAKSNLRWLEYSAFKIPTVASDVVPFRGIKNILLATEPEEWEAHLSHLIEDEKLRTNLGNSSYTESRNYFDLNVQSQVLSHAISKLF